MSNYENVKLDCMILLLDRSIFYTFLDVTCKMDFEFPMS